MDKFWRDHRKVKYMEALVRKGDGKVYWFGDSHSEMEHLKVFVRRSCRQDTEVII